MTRKDESIEYCHRELYRLLVFYKLLIDLLESFFGQGLIIFNDEMNRNYLRISNKIKEILNANCFEEFPIAVELPFGHLRSLDPDAPECDWQYHGQQICGDSLSEIEELFIKTGENRYELSPEDAKFVNSVYDYLEKYDKYKREENRRLFATAKKIAENQNPFQSSKASFNSSNVVFKINHGIWTYVERLFIHVFHYSDAFVSFLQKHGISGYKNSKYPLIYFENEENTDTTTFYHFMSNENTGLANHMRLIPYNKKLDILGELIFNEDVMDTRNHDWNYYGEYINGWYPRIINYLESAGFRMDFDDQKIVYGYETLDFWNYIHPEIVRVSRSKFNDGHYSDSVESAFKEINSRIKKMVEEKTGQELDGKTLMDAAFAFSKNSEPIILVGDLSKITGRNIQRGYKEIFSGSILAIRNPKAHDNIKITKEEAMHFIFLASLLMFKIDTAKSSN